MTSLFKPKRPAGEIVNPHVFDHVPEPRPKWIDAQLQARSEYYEMGALIQLLGWCSEELKRRNAGEYICGCGLRKDGEKPNVEF